MKELIHNNLYKGSKFMPIWNPFWTDEVKIENGGRYPLLLNRFHDHMEDYLIKGIVSTTDRLRYISYCCWAIGDIEKTLNCEKYYEFEEAFRRRESALAVGFYLLQPKTVVGNYTIYGSDGMKSKVDHKDKPFDCSFRILPSQPLGAFGQYYKGTMQNWGLIFVDEEGVIRLTSLGKKLYKIMDRIYSNSEYCLTYKGNKSVPGKVLKQWAKVNEYDNITDSAHKAERDFYKNVLFHSDKKEVSFRRDSLTIYIECIMECNKRQVNFNEDMLRNTLYYRRVKFNHKITPLKLSAFLDDAIFYWSLYEMHVYFRWWISEYFRFFLIKLRNSDGLTLNEVITDISTDIFNEKTNEILNMDINYYSLPFGELLSHISDINSPDEMFLEDDLTNIEVDNMSHFTSYLLIMLGLLYDKYKELKEDERYFDVKSSLIDDYWFDEFFREIDSIKIYSIPEVLKYLLNRYVIQKHDMAMYAKNDLRRCWFTKSNEKYQFQADSRSIWRPAKHRIICHFLFDMNVIMINNESIELTPEGIALYQQLKETIYYEA